MVVPSGTLELYYENEYVNLNYAQLETIEKKINDLGKKGVNIDTKGLKELEKIKIPEISIEGIETKSLQKEMKQLEKQHLQVLNLMVCVYLKKSLELVMIILVL